MKILITNDDGILSPCLPGLAAWAGALGDVTVVAPKIEQSAKSHSIDIRGAFAVEASGVFGSIPAFAVDSTPADCVRIALFHLGLKPDLVISGINKGYNLGNDILYSGTVSAACEAALFGIRSVALSAEGGDFSDALSAIDRVAGFFRERKLFDFHNFFNVNLPPKDHGIRLTRQGGLYFTDRFEKTEENLIRAKAHFSYENRSDPTFDTDAVTAGFISVTPLAVDRTARDVYEKLILR